MKKLLLLSSLVLAIFTPMIAPAGAISPYEVDDGETLYELGGQMGDVDAALKCPGVKDSFLHQKQAEIQAEADKTISGNPQLRKMALQKALSPFREGRTDNAKTSCPNIRELHPDWFVGAPSRGATSTTSGESCSDLWTARNSIYKEAGYCFKTAKAIKAFGNAGCSYDSVESVPLSGAQRQRVAEILRKERMARCPK